MELVWFDWTTNPDYADILSRPLYLGSINNHRKKIEEKRIRARKNRVKRNKILKKQK